MKKTRRIYSFIVTFLGFMIWLSALVLYAVLKKYGSLNFHFGNTIFTIDTVFVVIAICVIGIFLTIMGACSLFLKKSKQYEIAEKDERNVAIANSAKATAFEVMTSLFSIVLCVMALLGALTTEVFFAFFAVFAITQVVFVLRLWYLQKIM